MRTVLYLFASLIFSVFLFSFSLIMLIPVDAECLQCNSTGRECWSQFDCEFGCSCLKRNSEIYGVCF